MSKFRLVPPAGAPLPAHAVLSSAFEVRNDGKVLAELLRDQLKVRHVFFVSSGRAALTVILQVMKRVSAREEVVIPAYTCFSVPSAVVRAGLSIKLCDVDPKTFDLDHNALARLDLDKVLCIVPSSLYGMPSDLEALEQISCVSGAFLIDDAAQALGGTIAGRPCGSFGHAGFYSLGRGKNITAMGGGIIVTKRDDLAQSILSEVNKLPHPSSVNVLSSTLTSLFYAVMLSPSHYWLPDRIPFLGLGLSRFDPYFKMTKLSSYQERLASKLLPLMETYNRIRQANAEQLREGINGIEGIEIPKPINGAAPVYVRFPILTRDGSHRLRLLNGLRAADIGASSSYPTAIGDIPGISRYLAADQHPCPNAEWIAKRIITLPTHPYVTVGDDDKMIEIISRESRV